MEVAFLQMFIDCDQKCQHWILEDIGGKKKKTNKKSKIYF